MKLTKAFSLFCVICLTLYHCKTKNSESTVSDDSKRDSASTSQSSAHEPVSTSSKLKESTLSFKKLIALVTKEGVEIPKGYCPLLGIESENCYGGSLMEVKDLGAGQFLMAFSRSRGTTDSFNLYGITLVECTEDQLLGKNDIEIAGGVKYKFSFDHDTFFLVENKSYEGENEPDKTEMILRVVFDGKISALKDLGKPELSHCRNLIFAKYGLQFKSENLREYFSRFDWYKPVSSNVDDQLTANDKLVIDMIRQAEAVKN